MSRVTNLVALAAFVVGGFAVADTTKDLESTTTADTFQKVGTLYASALVARGDNVTCDSGRGWNEDVQDELEHFIPDFAAIHNGNSLVRGAESAEQYIASNGAKFFISVNNRACDVVKIEQAANNLALAVHTCQFDGSNQHSGGAVSYNVTSDAPNGCGHFVIAYDNSDSTATSTRTSKRSNTCSTCPQFCLNPDSTCNPPVWSGCTQQEKNCILADSDDFYGCLMAGNCVADETKAKRSSDACALCDGACLLTDTTCNPPVWNTCTSAEETCLLASASEYMGCLMAGNCVANKQVKRSADACSVSATCNPPVWSTCTSAEQSCLMDSASDSMGCLMAGNCVADKKMKRNSDACAVSATCNPPVWSTCTSEEQSCLMASASDSMGCLMAGNCVADKKVKRSSDACALCNAACLTADTTCNPPVWSTCTSAEQSCLLASASDFIGCLQAGNCVA